MKLRELMTREVVKIHPDDPVETAARTLAHYNIGALPVCGMDGRLLGVVTDRDLVTRCMAGGLSGATPVGSIMTGRVITAGPDMDAGAAAHLMGRQQIRRLPVVEQGKLCGMVSLADLANHEDCAIDASDALAQITGNVSER